MNNPVEATGNVCSTNSRRLDEMLAVQRALRRIDERPQQRKFHHGKFYIVTSWIFETQRLAVELPSVAKPKAAMAGRPSRADGRNTSHASAPRCVQKTGNQTALEEPARLRSFRSRVVAK